MDNFTDRKNLLDSALVRQFCNRSNRPAIIRLCIHLALIAWGMWIVSLVNSSWWLVPAWFFYGTLLVFLFAPLHECIHRTAFRNRLSNEIVATIAGFILLLPARYFRAFHFEHHRFTNDSDRDPELQTAKPNRLLHYIWAMGGLGTYWWPQIRTIVKHACGKVDENFIPVGDRAMIILEARIHLTAYVLILGISILAESSTVFTFWLAPLMLGMISLRMFLLAEHTGCELSDNMLRNTRTTVTNPLVNLIAWNMPYHCEHHMFPAVPFHQLPALHQHLKPKLCCVSDGYRQFHREFRRTL